MRSRQAQLARVKTPPRTPVAVLVALFAVIIQLMAPSSMMAAEAVRPAETMVVCTSMGIETMSVPMQHESGKGFAGLPCQDCLGPAVAALPASLAPPVAIAYSVTRIERSPLARYAVQPARAPPRPPGQGPPSSNV
jgi:hypothetical protein